jgi:hypothetical protein
MVAMLNKPWMRMEDKESDRRMFNRAPAEGTAQGHRMDHTIEARRNPRLSMQLRDVSLGGLAAVTDQPIQRGEQLSVTFPKRGLAPAFNACGRVVRCEATPFGYRIGIEFEPLLAA